MIARESIRVEGQRGAQILEVEYVEMPQFSSSEESGKLMSDLERETADLELECATLNDQIEVLQRRLEVLDGVARQVDLDKTPFWVNFGEFRSAKMHWSRPRLSKCADP